MKIFALRIVRLILGLFLYALGVVMTIRGNIGLSAWDVLHQGITLHTGMSMGVTNIIVASLIVLVIFLCGETVGLGTVLNMILIGTFMDFLLINKHVPLMEGHGSGFLLVVAGLFTIAFASFFYIGSGFGAGPRDSLMVILVKRTNLRVGVARAMVEGTVIFIGWLLGGFVGAGTVVAALGISVIVQIVFRVLRFDVKKVRQETLAETISEFRGMLR